jgi:hypothetical protein
VHAQILSPSPGPGYGTRDFVSLQSATNPKSCNTFCQGAQIAHSVQPSVGWGIRRFAKRVKKHCFCTCSNFATPFQLNGSLNGHEISCTQKCVKFDTSLKMRNFACQKGVSPEPSRSTAFWVVLKTPKLANARKHENVVFDISDICPTPRRGTPNWGSRRSAARAIVKST